MFIKNSLYNNAFYLMLNSAAASFLGFVFWSVTTRYFTPVQVGIGTALLSAANLLVFIGNLGLETSLVRFIPESGENTNNFINSTLTTAVVVTTAGLCIYLFGIKVWTPALSFIRNGIVLISIFIFTSIMIGLSGLLDQCLVAGRAARFVFYKNLAAGLMKIPLPLFMVPLGSMAVFVASGLSVTSGVFLAFFVFLPRIYPCYRPIPTWDRSLLEPVIRFSLGNYLSNFFVYGINLLFPLLIIQRLGPEYSAYFYIAWMLNSVVAVVAGGMSNSLFAEGANEPEKFSANLRRSLKITMLLLIPVIMGCYLVGPLLLKLFGADYHNNAKILLRYLAVSNFPGAIGYFFITANQIHKKIHLILIQAGMSFILILGFGYYFMGLYGLAGAGMAFLLAQLIIAFLVIVPLWKYINHE